jgi:N-carbamoylputrescine amidase
MTRSALTIALITDVFYDDPEGVRLAEQLDHAKQQGAELAVLPELPLNSWCPVRKVASDDDAEDPEGPRWTRQAAAARQAGMTVFGGAIIRDPETGRRHNTGLLFGEAGDLITSYKKVHLPEEEGFWETSHYEPGTEPPRVVEACGIRLGFQICSDINRPMGAQILAAQKADLILCPRATPSASYPRWRLVFRAAAVMSGAYVLSTNRPGPEAGVPIGGGSLLVGPDGTVLTETESHVTVMTIEPATVERQRLEYPAYLDFPANLYAQAWGEMAEGE